MKTTVYDLEIEQAAIKSLLDTLIAGWKRQDVRTMASLVSEDAMFYGNGPTEVYNKSQVTEGWSQMLEEAFPLDLLGEPKIKLAPDGNSAHAIQHYLMPLFSTIVQFRNGYYLIKENGKWLIYNCNTACLINDADFAKVNEALSK